MQRRWRRERRLRKTRQIIKSVSDSTYNSAYQIVVRDYNAYIWYFQHGYLHGFYFNFSYPPVYCGQYQFTPSPRPYYTNLSDTIRVLNSLHNNGDRIDNVGIW